MATYRNPAAGYWQAQKYAYEQQELLLNQRSNPQDGNGTNDGRSQLSEKTAPRNAQRIEEPAAEDTAKESKHQIHDEAEATTFH